MTTTVDLPDKIEEAITEKVSKGEYTSKSDFIKEAVRTHLDKILLAPEDVAERAEQVRSGDAETVEWEKVREEM
jgi:Arc/MetJ-type ribon-helix-helix transcriptional regulator